VKGGMASEMGFKDGDRLLSVNGQKVNSVWDVKLALRANAGKRVHIVLEREGKQEDREVKVPSSLP
jgi:C-terminal processing protease CtpA/Prc